MTTAFTPVAPCFTSRNITLDTDTATSRGDDLIYVKLHVQLARGVTRHAPRVPHGTQHHQVDLERAVNDHGVDDSVHLSAKLLMEVLLVCEACRLAPPAQPATRAQCELSHAVLNSPSGISWQMAESQQKLLLGVSCFLSLCLLFTTC